MTLPPSPLADAFTDFWDLVCQTWDADDDVEAITRAAFYHGAHAFAARVFARHGVEAVMALLDEIAAEATRQETGGVH